MAFSLGNQDKLALMMTLFGSQRKLAEALGVSHQRVGRWLREGQPALIDPETGDQLKSAGAKKIPDDASHLINGLFQIHKQVTRDQAKADGLFYDSRIPVFLQRPVMNNGQQGLRIYAEHTQYLSRSLRNDYLGLAYSYGQFIAASVRSEINIFSYIGSTPNESARKRFQRYQNKAIYTAHKDGTYSLNHKTFGGSAESMIQAGGRVMPVYTKYEKFSGRASPGFVVKNINVKLEKHELHSDKFADMFLFQLKSQPSNETTNKTKSAKRVRSTRPRRAR